MEDPKKTHRPNGLEDGAGPAGQLPHAAHILAGLVDLEQPQGPTKSVGEHFLVGGQSAQAVEGEQCVERHPAGRVRRDGVPQESGTARATNRRLGMSINRS